jgi:hypothetical protein
VGERTTFYLHGATKEELMFQSRSTHSASRYERRSWVLQTPALVVATLALVLSLGGAAYASGQLGGGASLSNTVTLQKLTLVNGWVSENSVYGTGNPSAGVSNGVVYLSGSLGQPTPGSSTFTILPPADRPVHDLYVTVYTNGDTSGTLFIANDGTVEAYSGTACGSGDTSQCFTSLATVSFPKNS